MKEIYIKYQDHGRWSRIKHEKDWEGIRDEEDCCNEKTTIKSWSSTNHSWFMFIKDSYLKRLHNRYKIYELLLFIVDGEDWSRRSMIENEAWERLRGNKSRRRLCRRKDRCQKSAGKSFLAHVPLTISSCIILRSK